LNGRPDTDSLYLSNSHAVIFFGASDGSNDG